MLLFEKDSWVFIVSKPECSVMNFHTGTVYVFKTRKVLPVL